MRRTLLFVILLAACRGADTATAPTTGPSYKPLGKVYPVIDRAIRTQPIEIAGINIRDGAGRLISDGAGQTVHPSVVWLPRPWHGSSCYMGINPYPWGRATHENPSVYRCLDSITFVESSEMKNPVFDNTGFIHNSDINLVLDPSSDKLYLFNRAVTYDSNIVTVNASEDGFLYGKRSRSTAAPRHFIVSPSITFGPDGIPRLFSVNPGAEGCGAQETKVELRLPVSYVPGMDLRKVVWGPPLAVRMSQPGYIIWHGEVKWIAELSLYVAVTSDYPKGGGYGCAENDNFLSTSTDGVNFISYRTPIFWRESPILSAYKATFAYDAKRDLFMTWVSVLKQGSEWRTLYVSYDWTELYQGLKSEALAAPAMRYPKPSLTAEDRKLLQSIIMP